MDLLILADRNGVVDMTHEAISRRTNRPIRMIRKTIEELEGPDPRSRTPDMNGARLFRLDEHRDWGWGIVNYDYFRNLASEEQRREKTRIRVNKHRRKSLSVTQCNAPVTQANDLPSISPFLSVLKSERVRERFKEWMPVRKSMGKKPKDWDKMFTEQCQWLNQFNEADQMEIISASIRNNWQGLHEPKQKKQERPTAQSELDKRLERDPLWREMQEKKK